ncbi:uncharacterized protein BJ171DRAFT_509405 [Polychytrium aggregatum]|uniref:uncharacterized protein n=1 Tax=Polychytrium aggregatum TaxID=110093 RepID=UPI0022FDE1CB|nr:uncharacterized protein BJ171DRAFT_509405 [Polychytrium aggregatum]KAI9203720.1 hypothetical protein BJ171DRAFT_509405 [Polychytrium aggregatum]
MSSIADSTPPAKRPKQSRTTRACDVCRLKRNKCSGDQPCTSCRESGFTCTYEKPQLKRGPQPRNQLPVSVFPQPGRGNPPLLASSFQPAPAAASSTYGDPETGMWGGDLCAILDSTIGTTTYLGATSLGGGRCLEHCPRNPKGLIEFAVASPVSALLLIPRTKSIPFCEELTQALIRSFFATNRSITSMFHLPYFEQEYNAEMHTEPFSLLVWTICAFVSLQNGSLANIGFRDVASTQRTMFNHCIPLLKRLQQFPNIHTLRSLIIWSLICLDSTELIRHSTGSYLALACSMAIELALHLDIDDMRNPPLDDATKKIYHGTFFSLYTADRLSAFISGRPAFIRDDMWDASLLSYQWPDEDYSFMLMFVDLGRIGSDIIDILNGPKFFNTEERRTAIGRRADAELDRFWANLPAYYRAVPEEAWTGRHWLHLRYYCLKILTKRMISARHTPESINCARSIVKCFRSFPRPRRGEYVFQRSLCSHLAMVAATVLLDVITAMSSSGGGGTEEKVLIISELNETLVLLEDLGVASSVRLRQIIDKCINWQTVQRRSLEVTEQRRLIEPSPTAETAAAGQLELMCHVPLAFHDSPAIGATAASIPYNSYSLASAANAQQPNTSRLQFEAGSLVEAGLAPQPACPIPSSSGFGTISDTQPSTSASASTLPSQVAYSLASRPMPPERLVRSVPEPPELPSATINGCHRFNSNQIVPPNPYPSVSVERRQSLSAAVNPLDAISYDLVSAKGIANPGLTNAGYVVLGSSDYSAVQQVQDKPGPQQPQPLALYPTLSPIPLGQAAVATASYIPAIYQDTMLRHPLPVGIGVLPPPAMVAANATDKSQQRYPTPPQRHQSTQPAQSQTQQPSQSQLQQQAPPLLQPLPQLHMPPPPPQPLLHPPSQQQQRFVIASPPW